MSIVYTRCKCSSIPKTLDHGDMSCTAWSQEILITSFIYSGSNIHSYKEQGQGSNFLVFIAAHQKLHPDVLVKLLEG